MKYKRIIHFEPLDDFFQIYYEFYASFISAIDLSNEP